MPGENELAVDQRLFGKGNKFPIRATALDQDTLKQGTEVTVWSKQMPQDKVGWFGHGREVREYAEAFVFYSLVASGNGTGTAGDALTGDVVIAITDSEQKRVLKSITFDDLSQLADAEASDRTDRPVMAALAPYAKPGRHLEVRIVADSASDGKEIDPASSTGQLYYTLY